jgi:predicted nucleic acid-binding protein
MYSSIYLSLVNKGCTIPLNAVWIAACCLEIGGTLLTMDSHIVNVDQIETIILT